MIVVSGAVVCIVHVYVAGVASVLPTVSVARTWKLCEPSASDDVVSGDVQGVKTPPSSEHWKVAVSVAVKLKLDVELLLKIGGFAVIVVSGAAVSIVHVYVAGVASMLPDPSVALTWKL